MLFSATLSKNVKDLARLSLKKEPVYVGVHDTQEVATAAGLEQGYVVCLSELRFLLLFTFLKKNIKKKIIVFFSSCNAVKFYAELLNYIDIPVLELHVRQITRLPFEHYFVSLSIRSAGPTEAAEAHDDLL